MSRAGTSRPLAFIVAAALLALATAASPATAKRPSPPWEGYCHPRLNEIDYRYIHRYQHRLQEHSSGMELVLALRKCTDGGGGVVSAGPCNHKRVAELLLLESVEEDRQWLHRHAQIAFACVDEFERKAAGDAEGRDWHKPHDFTNHGVGKEDPHFYDDSEDLRTHPGRFDWDNHDARVMHPEGRRH